MCSMHQLVAWLAACAAVGAAWAAPALYAARLSEAEWGSYSEREPQGPGTYNFGYDVEDPLTGNTQFRQEERHPNGTVTGSYGSVQPDGNVQIVHYIADHLGYRVTIENSLRHSEDYPPKHVTQSPQLISAVASQLGGQSPVHEQHVRPISNKPRAWAPQRPINYYDYINNNYIY